MNKQIEDMMKNCKCTYCECDIYDCYALGYCQQFADEA